MQLNQVLMSPGRIHANRAREASLQGVESVYQGGSRAGHQASLRRFERALRIIILYRLPVVPRCGRVYRQAYYVWGMEDAGILFPQRTGGGRAAALGTTREWACLPAGSDDREHARGNGA